MKHLLIIGTIFISGLLALSQDTNLVKAGDLDLQGPNSFSRAAELFNSMPNADPVSPYAVVSSYFTDAALSGAHTAGADDFYVPTCGWQITEVSVRGGYSDPINTGNLGPASSVNVYILNNSGTLPDTTNLSAGAIYAAESLPYTDAGSGDFEITLPSDGVLLLEGHYWLVVQANIEIFAVGQWNWTEAALSPNSGTTNGEESAWFQSQALVASPYTGTATCVGAWNARVTNCQITRNPDTNPPADRDFAFRLGGNVLTPGVTVSPTSLSTAENGSPVNYTVVLDSPPEAGETVTVTPASGDSTEGTVSGPINFTSANWDIPQNITVTPGAAGDGNDGDVMFSITNTVSTIGGTCYSGVTASSVSVTNANIEGVATILVDPASSLVVSEDGTVTDTFTIYAAPGQLPTNDVTVNLTNNSPTEVSLSAASALLTAGNNYSVTITVTGVADNVVETTMPFSITTEPATSADLAYSGVNPVDVSGSVTDSNTASVVATPNNTPLQTDEYGATDSIDYVLTAQPTMDVSFTLSSDDPVEASVSPSTLTFTNANWDTPQTVTVTGQNDFVDDGTETYSIIGTPTTSGDSFWQGIAVPSVAGENADDTDTAGITTDDLGGVITTEAGGTDQFTVVLDSQPVFDVTVTLTSNDTTEGLLSTTGGAPFTPAVNLTFTSANWDTPQTVTVEGQDDPLVDGDFPYTIAVTVASGDPVYDGMVGTPVNVLNLDDDVCGPMTLDVVIGQSIYACGTPGCVFDLYDVCPDQVFLGTFTIPAGGCIDTGVIGQPDNCYIATVSGNDQAILAGPVTMVPTVGTWGLVVLFTLLGVCGLIFLRRSH